MERVCFCLQVKPDRIAEYRERHAAVWPEMLAALAATGWHDYSLFLRDDGLLVGTFRTPSLADALAGMAATEVNARWQAEMAELFEDLGDARPDTGFVRLTEVFSLEEQLARTTDTTDRDVSVLSTESSRASSHGGTHGEQQMGEAHLCLGVAGVGVDLHLVHVHRKSQHAG